MDNICDIYKMLDWQAPLETQSEGIRLANELDDLSLLIMPPASPSVWERCAEVLSGKSDSELEPYLNGLLEWLDDLNWAGALTVSNRLKTFSGEKLKEPYVKCVANAQKSGNIRWLYWLSDLLENKELESNLPQETLQILYKAKSTWLGISI